MIRTLLQNFDRLSFWFGFITALLLWWLVGRFRPILSPLLHNWIRRSTTARIDRYQLDEIRINNVMLQLAQGWHIASPLFSLDEIYIPTRLLAPAPLPYAYEPPLSEDITDWVLPYTPDIPEFASYFHAPTIDILEALKGNANLALVGGPGSGKSTALAQLCCQIIRLPPGIHGQSARLPILLHIGELDLPTGQIDNSDEILSRALSGLVKSIKPKRFLDVFEKLLDKGRFILLLDGLDELDPENLRQAVLFLENLLSRHPNLQTVVAAHPGNLGRLPALGFRIVGLESWSSTQRALFCARWSDLWIKYLDTVDPQRTNRIEPLLMVGWVAQSSRQFTPLELILKIWSAFAGDSLGPSRLDAIEAYIRRMTANQPRKNRMGLEQLAGQMVLAGRAICDRKEAEHWLGGADAGIPHNPAQSNHEYGDQKIEDSNQGTVRARGALPDLLDSGLLLSRSGDRIGFSHPTIISYLASKWIFDHNAARELTKHHDWIGRSAALNYIALVDSRLDWFEDQVNLENEDILQYKLLQAGAWLINSPADSLWIPALLRRLALCIQNNQLPLGLRARALYAFASSGSSGVLMLLRQLLNDPNPLVRQLAVVGLGYLKDRKSLESIIALVEDKSIGVSRAALLALVAIGAPEGLEAVAFALLNAEESFRKAAAEALANDPEEGHLALREGSQLEDPIVRRAVVFGLSRTGLPWAEEILHKLAADDPQWMVQDAANQVISSIRNNPRTPCPIPIPAQTPWLIAFAGERGVGISPGKPVFAILRRVLEEGNNDQRLAVIFYLGQTANPNSVVPLYQIYKSEEGELKEAAFNALWNLHACGIMIESQA